MNDGGEGTGGGKEDGWDEGVLLSGSLVVRVEGSNITFEGFKWKGEGNRVEIIGVSKARLAIKVTTKKKFLS